MKQKVKYVFCALVVILLICLSDIVWVKSNERVFFDDLRFKAPALEALKKFPELKGRDIMFLSSGRAKTWAHKAVPRISTLLLPEKYRVYQILIAEDQYGSLTSTLFKNLEPKSKVGVLGHELAHVLSYTEMNSLEVLFVGLKYFFSDDYRTVFERDTNCLALERGLREEILSWSEEVYEHLVHDDRGRYYHSPHEIMEGVGCQ